MAEMDDIRRRLIELHRLLTHYQVTGQRNKAAETLEEKAEIIRVYFPKQLAQAVNDLEFAARNWRSYGEDIWKNKKDETEARAAYKRGLADLDEADSLDPSTVHLRSALRAKIGNSIKSLPTKPVRNKPKEKVSSRLWYHAR